MNSTMLKEPWRLNAAMGADYTDVSMGTCHGLVAYRDNEHEMLAVMNEQPGNGDFAKFMDYLEAEAHKKGVPFTVIEIWNKWLYKHLTDKRGYIPLLLVDGLALYPKNKA